MNKSIKKVVSIALSATTVVWLTGAGAVLPVAFAQSTTSEIASLQALITQLTAQLGALQGSSSVVSTTVVPASSGACGFTRNLTVGSTGADVKCLQQYLNGAGFAVAASGAGSPGSESSYFGSLTKAAVVKWQDANATGVLVPAGLTKGTGFWGPSSRNYYGTLGVAVVTPVTPGTGVTPPVVGPVTPVGGLVVSLGSGNPASANIPKGASSIPYLQLVVSGSGKLDSLTFVRTGLGLTGDFVSGGVYLYDGGVRLTTGKSVNSTTHEVKFVSLNKDISGSKTYMLVADMASGATAGNLSGFKLTHVNGEALTSPIRGNEMAISGTSVGGITIAENGSVAAPNIGAVGVKIGEFKLTNTTVNSISEDMNVRRIVLTHGGSANVGYLTNFELRQAGVTLAKVAGYSGRDQFILELTSPFKILKGQNRIFEVYGDVSPLAKASDTINLYIDNTADVLVTGDTYGYGAVVTNSWASSDQTLTLLGADILITWHGPQARNIAAKAQDLTLFDFSISSKNNIEIRNLNFTNTVTYAANGGFNDYKVVDAETGSAVTSSKDLTNTSAQSGASAAAQFTDVVNITAGSVRRFLVKADIDPDNIANDSIKVSLDAFGTSGIKNLDNNTFIAPSTDVVPNAAVTGATQTVKTVSLDVLAAGIPAAHTAVAGSTGESLLGVSLTARNGNVKVTSMKISASSTTGTAAQTRNALRSLGLYIDGTLVSSKKSLVADSTVSSATFSNLSIVVPEGQVKTVVVKADDIATDAAAVVYFVYLDAANTTAVDVEGNSLTLSGNINGTATSAGSVTLTVGTPTIMAIKVTDQESEAGNVIAGKEQLLSKYDFFAKNATQTVTKMKVGVNTAATVATTTALNQEVASIRLYDGTGKLLASGSPESSGTHAGSVRFENISGLFTVNANETKRIEVRALLNSIDLLGSGAVVSSLAGYVDGGSFESVSGATTNTALKDSAEATISAGAGVAGDLKRMFRTVPVVTVSSPSSSTLTTGQVELLKFTVAADASGDVEWAKLEATVSLSNATLTVDTIKVRYAGTDLTTTTATVATTGGEAVIGLTTPERIAAGTSRTYELLATVSAMAGTTTAASISTILRRDESAYATPAAYLTTEVAANSFVWSDLSRQPHSTTAADWHNGWKVKTLPSGAKALVK